MGAYVAALGQGIDFDMDTATAALSPHCQNAGVVWRSTDGRAILGGHKHPIGEPTVDEIVRLFGWNGRFQILYNGKIHNAATLRQELKSAGEYFHSVCDSEVILLGYAKWGRAVLERLIGAFSFVIWDDQEKTAFGARDRVGVKPFFLADKGGGLVMASGAGALIAGLRSLPRLEPMALAYVLTIGYVPSPLSIWTGILKLPPGHCVQWSPKFGTRIEKYWEPPRCVSGGNGRHPEFQNLFTEIAGEHLPADTPIGLCASTGLEYSALAVACSEHDSRDEVTAYRVTPGSSGPEHSEDATARHLGLPYRHIVTKAEHIEVSASRALGVLDEPIVHNSLLQAVQATRALSGHCGNLLMGDGSDDIFGRHMLHSADKARSSSLQAKNRTSMTHTVGQALSMVTSKSVWAAFQRANPFAGHVFRMFPGYLAEEVASILKPALDRFTDRMAHAPLARQFERQMPLCRALQRVNIGTFVPDCTAAGLEHLGAAHSIKVLMPFLDHRLIEWSLTRPVLEDETRVDNAVLRRYLRGRVPPQVLYRHDTVSVPSFSSGIEFDQLVARISISALFQEGVLSETWRTVSALDVPHKPNRIWALYALAVWYDEIRMRYLSWKSTAMVQKHMDTSVPPKAAANSQDWPVRRATG